MPLSVLQKRSESLMKSKNRQSKKRDDSKKMLPSLFLCCTNASYLIFDNMDDKKYRKGGKQESHLIILGNLHITYVIAFS